MSAEREAIERATAALGVHTSRLGSGALVATVYSRDAVDELRALGYAVTPHERFPGNEEPGVMFEAVWTAPRELEAEA